MSTDLYNKSLQLQNVISVSLSIKSRRIFKSVDLLTISFKNGGSDEWNLQIRSIKRTIK